jgi:DnaJ-domain-containing protein 1
MNRLSDGPFGPADKKLADLTGEELAAERARRRGDIQSEEQPTLQRVKQYLANLELDPGATWPEIERAYNRLRDRYHPDKHRDHPERHETAVELTESLSRAYQALRRYFKP